MEGKAKVLFGIRCLLCLAKKDTHSTYPRNRGDKADDQQHIAWKRGREGEDARAHEREME